MNKDEIDTMWFKALHDSVKDGEQFTRYHFAALVAAAERDACLQQIEIIVDAEREMCAKVAEQTICDTHLPTGVKIYGSKAAAAIRARGQA